MSTVKEKYLLNFCHGLWVGGSVVSHKNKVVDSLYFFKKQVCVDVTTQ